MPSDTGNDREAMSEPVRLIIIHEEVGYGCGCLEDPEFILLGPTVASIKEWLDAALADHFGEPVAYWIVSEPEQTPHRH